MLPLGEKEANGLREISRFGLPDQQFNGCGRGPGTRVHKGDLDFTARECLVEDRQITDDHGQKSEAEARFDDGKNASPYAMRDQISEAEGKKSGTAEIEIPAEAAAAAVRAGNGGAEAPLHESEAEHHRESPND